MCTCEPGYEGDALTSCFRSRTGNSKYTYDIYYTNSKKCNILSDAFKLSKEINVLSFLKDAMKENQGLILLGFERLKLTSFKF